MQSKAQHDPCRLPYQHDRQTLSRETYLLHKICEMLRFHRQRCKNNMALKFYLLELEQVCCKEYNKQRSEKGGRERGQCRSYGGGLVMGLVAHLFF